MNEIEQSIIQALLLHMLHGLVPATDTRLYDSSRVHKCAFPLSSFPGLPCFYLPLFCLYNNTRERKTSEKQRRPGSIHHVNGNAMDVGGMHNKVVLSYVCVLLCKPVHNNYFSSTFILPVVLA